MRTTEEILTCIRQACTISRREEDESEPYKNKYQAADLLDKVLGERTLGLEQPAPIKDSSTVEKPVVQTLTNPCPLSSDSFEAVGSSGCSHTSGPSVLELAAAAARIRGGLILLETELLSDGESRIEAGLNHLEKCPEAYLAWLLESYNALGALYSERGELPVALKWLQRAEQLYQQITGTGTEHSHMALPTASQQTAANATQEQLPGRAQDLGRAVGLDTRSEGFEAVACPAPDAGAPDSGAPDTGAYESGSGRARNGLAEVEAAARVTSEQGSQTLELRAAATTDADRPAVHLCTNPPQLGLSGGGVPTVTSLPGLLPDNDIDAVQVQYTRTLYYLAQVHGHMKSADLSALYCAATLYRQLTSGKYDLDTWVNNCLQLGGYYANVHAFGLAVYCHAAAQAVVDRDTDAGAVLGEDIEANVKLATARVYGMRLAASHSKFVEGKELEMQYLDVSSFPDYLRFPGLSVPSPDSLPWGQAALADTFEAAREFLNKGMPYFKAALSYYQLDGWVTEHVGILMDMSNMYRCLTGFETDGSRAAAMHRCRAQVLEPLSGALNPEHYPGLSRSIDLELAHIFREISDVREMHGDQAAKASTAAATAVKYYHRFLRSFVPSGSNELPDRVDQDNEPYFLMASFGLGRMMIRMRGAAMGAHGGRGKGTGPASDAEAGYEALVLSAQQHLNWTCQYVKRHGLDRWTEEAQAAEELKELLVEQMRLRAATRR